MTDAEMMELAAKAVGIEVTVWPTGHREILVDGEEWNPLTDDGDALRLLHAIYGKSNTDHWIRVYDSLWYGSIEDTRRAIVRAAAEIEKSRIPQ